MRFASDRSGLYVWFSRATSLLIWLSLALLVLLIVYRWASAPQTKGELELAGLEKPVQVLRDRFAVPHIFAQSETDAHFALGVVHAQDRLWQLEMSRRLVNGELAEVLGEPALAFDRFVRTLGVAGAAASAWASLSPESQTQISAYVRGLNAGVGRALRSPWLQSPEFWLLNTRPSVWRELDVLLVSKMLSWEQSAHHSADLLRLAMLQRLDPLQIAQLFELPPGLLNTQQQQFYRSLAPKALSLLNGLPFSAPEGTGSNAWLVDAAHSVSTRPLLANDPHMSLKAPGTWYLAHLSAPGFDVIGATIPGLPAVLLGRADRLAWGLTNHGADIQDIYLERLNPLDAAQYQTPEGWANFAVRDEEIRVKGAQPVRLTVRQSRHGPVISDALPSAEQSLKAAKTETDYVFALAWTGLDSIDQSLDAWLRLNRARSSKELLDSLSGYGSAPMNVLYADVEGKAGLKVIGSLPKRNPASELRGALPAPGWEARHDWQGRISPRDLPGLQPRDGILANSNQRWAVDAYRHELGVDWTGPARFDRVMQLLRNKPKHELDSFVAMQGDVQSLPMRALLPFLKQIRIDDPFAALLVQKLSNWDGVMNAEHAEPLIASAWVEQLYRQLFGDELGDDLLDRFLAHRNRSKVLLNVLSDPALARWCDRIETPVTESCGQMLTQSMSSAIAELRARYGDDPQLWRWGVAHQAVSEHLPFSRVALLDKLFEVRVATPGDANTINAGRTDPAHRTEPFANRHAAGYRGVYDLADPDKSLFIQSTGQSGHVLSGHYRDLATRWARLEYIPMISQRLEVERQAAARLSLLPMGPR